MAALAFDWTEMCPTEQRDILLKQGALEAVEKVVKSCTASAAVLCAVLHATEALTRYGGEWEPCARLTALILPPSLRLQ
jgi:hypothetical protein